jgi:hypothetical protein
LTESGTGPSPPPDSNHRDGVKVWRKKGIWKCQACDAYTSGYRCVNRTDLKPLPTSQTKKTGSSTLRIPTDAEIQRHNQSVDEFWKSHYGCTYDGDENLDIYSCVAERISASSLTKEQKSNRWMVDSGTSDHISPYRSDFAELPEYGMSCSTASNSTMAVYGPGKVVIKHKNEEGERIIVLNEVYYAPKGNQRLLSVIKLTKQGYTCTVDDKTRIWDTQGHLLITASPVSDRSALHWFTSVTMTPRAAMNHLELNASYDIWHKRLGHCSKNAIRHLSTATSNFPAITVPETSPPCRGCLLGKATQRSFPPSKDRGSKPLDLVHTDLAEFPTLSRHQNKWMITFIDDYSSFGCIMFLKRKSDAIDRIKDWLAWAENQSDLKLKRLRSDRGGEYISQDLSTFLNSRGIEHQKTVPRTHNRMDAPKDSIVLFARNLKQCV